jgi:hypothetical protein
MNSSSRAKLLGVLFGVLLLGSVGYLIIQGRADEEKAEKAKETLGKAIRKENPTPGADRPRCPDCGKELPTGGECPFCLMKKAQAKAEGKAVAEPTSRSARYFAYSIIGVTLTLGMVYAGVHMRKVRGFRRPVDEMKLKTKCPYCKRRVSFPVRLEGTYGSCPTCKNRIRFNPAAI